MARVIETDLAGTLEQLRAQVAELSERIRALEKPAPSAVQPVAAAPVHTEPAPAAGTAAITEEELLAISAAIGAYLGVRAHIRQIRLLSTSAWAQQGRVSIQASHSLQT
jgi:methylmalonyl-CoA carboxyltransferase large subunit